MENTTYVVAQASDLERANFFRKTYGLVALAFAGFAALLYAFFISGVAESVIKGMMALSGSMGSFSWIIIMLAFWGGTVFAQKLASDRASRGSQYAGLGLYVLLEALIFIPLIWMVSITTKGDIGTILIPACTLTGALVAGLSLAVYLTRIDFSFLRVAIIIGSVCAIGAVIVFMIMGINPGTWFSLAMILLMATVILYQTSVIKNQLSTEDYVLAAFILFSAFVTMLWYVIQFFIGRRSE